MSKTLKNISILIILVFALIGVVLTGGYVAVRTGLTNTEGIIDLQNRNFIVNKGEYIRFSLAHTPEWVAFRQAIAKDKPLIDRISKDTGVSSRTLIALLVPEQMRLFYSDRPLFKKIFSPLKILGAQSQFSWGIFGIKEETAKLVEIHLKDKTSPYYLGPKFEKTLDFKTEDHDKERFERITDQHDHTYSYLYAALYILQINKQWENKGFSIKNRPEILATLWNLGFSKSIPNADPKSGGATMDINGKEYSFGALAYEFYYSDELIELFDIK